MFVSDVIYERIKNVAVFFGLNHSAVILNISYCSAFSENPVLNKNDVISFFNLSNDVVFDVFKIIRVNHSVKRISSEVSKFFCVAAVINFKQFLIKRNYLVISVCVIRKKSAGQTFANFCSCLYDVFVSCKLAAFFCLKFYCFFMQVCCNRIFF